MALRMMAMDVSVIALEVKMDGPVLEGLTTKLMFVWKLVEIPSLLLMNNVRMAITFLLMVVLLLVELNQAGLVQGLILLFVKESVEMAR